MWRKRKTVQRRRRGWRREMKEGKEAKQGEDGGEEGKEGRAEGRTRKRKMEGWRVEGELRYQSASS